MTDSQAHLRIVRVDVEDGSVDDPAHVSAVRAGAGVAGVSREPDLEQWCHDQPIRVLCISANQRGVLCISANPVRMFTWLLATMCTVPLVV